MRFIIGTILFWITILGIENFIKKKTKIDEIFLLPMTFTLLGIVMFISGILNIMKASSLLILIVGAGYFCYSFVKEKNKKDKLITFFKNPTNIIIIIMFGYITILGYNMHLMDYDNFSHWGLIVKNMFITNHLPNFENTAILFKGYQPGSACFIYFYGLLSGKGEGTMIIAQNYLIFSYLIPLMTLSKNKNKLINCLIILCFYIFIMTISIKFNSLLVDGLIAVMTIFSLMIINKYEKNLKKAFLYSLPVSVFLLLVKNTGLILALINCLYIFVLGIKNHRFKESCKYIIYTLIVLGVVLLLWQQHVKLAYGYMALNSKHSLDSSNIINSLRKLGIHNMLLFIKMYIKHFFSFKNNISNIYIVVINLLLVVMSFFKKEKKEVYKLMAIVDIIYVGYYSVLGAMYILSMPWEEAKIFASYERYMTTINIIIIGMIFIYLFKNSEKFKFYNTLVISISIMLLIPIYFYQNNFKSLLGKDNYIGSDEEKWDKIITKIPVEREGKYYIFAPTTYNAYGFFNYLSIYKLNNNNIEIIKKHSEIKENDTKYIIMYEDNEEFRKKLEKQKYVKVNYLVYKKLN